MSGGLRKDGGDGHYLVTGTLSGISGPGRRVVQHLELRRFSQAEGAELEVLRAFPDLSFLTLRQFGAIDLGCLRGLRVQGLGIFGANPVDLEFVNELPCLWALDLVDVDATAVPAIALPRALESLNLAVFDDDVPGARLAQLVAAIDWRRLRRLQSLRLAVGENHPDAPIELDLGFLAHLTELERLDIPEGVVHRGPDPSPLQPPFVGLAETVREIRIEAEDPQSVRTALCERLGVAPDDVGAPSVRGLREREPTRPPWEIRGPEDSDGVWSAYGRLRDVADDDQTEYEAVDRARAALAAADRALLDRLTFDPENAGTGIEAGTREDLSRALAILRATRRG